MLFQTMSLVNGEDAQQLSRAMDHFYERRVEYSDALMRENMGIADDFATNFLQFCRNENAFHPFAVGSTIEKQGRVFVARPLWGIM